VARLNRTVVDECIRTAFSTTLYESADALQKDLDNRLHEHNHDRPHRGYRDRGRRPMKKFAVGKNRREEMLWEAAQPPPIRED